MATTYTANKYLGEAAYGDTNWNSPLNATITNTDQALGTNQSFNLAAASGIVAVSGTTYVGAYPGNTPSYVPLSWTLTGTLTANVNLQFPANIGGHWVVYNNTTMGAYTITVSVSGGSATVTLAAGTQIIYSDAAGNIRFAVNAISGPGSTTSGDLATWNNTTGTLMADSGVPLSSVITSTRFTSFKNPIRNGRFMIDQRNSGAAFTITAAAAFVYTVDGWWGYCTGANVTGQQIANPGSNGGYRLRYTGAASNTGVQIGNRMEANDTFQFAGQTTTLQVKAFGSSATTLTWTAYYANTTNTFGTIASPTKTQIATGTFSVTTTEAIYSTTIAVPSAAITGIEIVFSVASLLASATLTLGDVQLELGSTATSVELPSYPDQLLRNQRYYMKLINPGTNGLLGSFGYASAGNIFGQSYSMNQMFAAPSVAATAAWVGVNCNNVTFLSTVSTWLVYATATTTAQAQFYPGSGQGLTITAEIP